MGDDSCRLRAGNYESHMVEKGFNKPQVQDVPGDLPKSVRAAEDVLTGTHEYFRSGASLVRVVDRRRKGVSVEQVYEQTLKLVLAEKIDWLVKSTDGIPIRINPPHGVVQALLHGQDSNLPELNGLARQPYFSPDGRYVSKSGYDPDTGIYGAFEEKDYALVDPTRASAEEALAYLLELLREFEFPSEADRAGALAAMLTAAVRPSLRTAPAFNITATGPGSGKSYLADVITPFAGAEEPYRVSFPEKHDEASKLIVTVLRERPPAVVFDDMQTNWKSLGPLNRAISSPFTTERILRTNSTATVPTNMLFIGTGNGCKPERDMRRRVLTIKLAPACEQPALRTFANDPVTALRKDRAKAVTHALTIIRAYQAADDQAPLSPVANFEGWSRYCRDPLMWLGLADPATSLIQQVSEDPEQELWAELLKMWDAIFGSRSITVRQLLAKAHDHDGLRDILEEFPFAEGNHINRNRLGWFISKREGLRAGGLRIEKGDSTERNSWKVVKD